MTKTYAIRPLSYSNFTNREFESLMMDTHQSLATFSKANKDEGMYFKLNLRLWRRKILVI